MRLFITPRAYAALITLVLIFVLGYYLPVFYAIAQGLFIVLLSFFLLDGILLFGMGGRLSGVRVVFDRLSNGDENQVTLKLESTYRVEVHVQILDEIPEQFQRRDFSIEQTFKSQNAEEIAYSLVPKTRGQYQFGYINLLARTSLGLLIRRFIVGEPNTVRVYPSFIHINQLELAAISRQLVTHGQKLVRKVGNSQEFDSIRSYVLGDDPRHINWKATARRSDLQVNHYVDEKSQGVYCLIDKSRSMKMPFNRMTLLDYAINASLVLSHVALNKGDQAGLLTFEDRPSTFVKAASIGNQMHKIMETLYREQTSFNEVDFGSLYAFGYKNIVRRSLLLLFTNFESVQSLERQLPYFQLLNRRHLLLVVFFRNTEVDKVINDDRGSVKAIYQKAIAYQMIDEKRLIGEKLQQAGILHLYSRPEQLSVNVINRYIDIKTRRLL